MTSEGKELTIGVLPVAGNKLRGIAEEFIKAKPKVWVLTYLTEEGHDTKVHCHFGEAMQLHEVVGMLQCAAMEAYKDD